MNSIAYTRYYFVAVTLCGTFARRSVDFERRLERKHDAHLNAPICQVFTPSHFKAYSCLVQETDSQEKAISVSQLIGKAFCLGQVKPVCSLLPLWQLLVDTCVASSVFYKQFGLQFLSRIYLETVRCWDFRVYFWLNFETFCCHRSNYLLPLCILQMHEEYICAPMLRFTYR